MLTSQTGVPVCGLIRVCVWARAQMDGAQDPSPDAAVAVEAASPDAAPAPASPGLPAEVVEALKQYPDPRTFTTGEFVWVKMARAARGTAYFAPFLFGAFAIEQMAFALIRLRAR